jgi:glucan phosphoethanolaminetransferase (alkaline phosphatase superfamily)
LKFLIIFSFIIFLSILIFRKLSNPKKNLSGPEISWAGIAMLLVLEIICYVFLEWLFIITKPSYLSAVPFQNQLEAGIISTAIISGAGLLVLLVFFIISRITPLKNIVREAAVLLPALILSALILLLIDNFTYSVLKWGIVNSAGYQKVLYVILFGFILHQTYFSIRGLAASIEGKEPRSSGRAYILPAMIVVLILVIAFSYNKSSITNLTNSSSTRIKSGKLPNIILVTADGINADQTSVYGYEKDTTPIIRALAEKSLVAENAFSNAGNTAGSLISIYTGKYPMDTRVLYPPDILRGEDSYQHLPGILKSLGYFTAEYAAPRYADAYDLNLLSGFDIANGRGVQNEVVFTTLNEFFHTDEAYLVFTMYNRITERLGHIFFIADMAGEQILIKGKSQNLYDQSKIFNLVNILRAKDVPAFIHIHWMGTHAGRFTPEVESDESINDENIAVFDAGIGQIIAELTRSGQMDNTILIVGSDHGRMYYTTKRIPLLFHFPNDEFAGSIKSDVQNLDIPVTILDYLGIAKPDWMVGKSLLEGEPGNRILFGAGVPTEIRNTGFVAKEYMNPPFYQFGYISAVYCDTWYRYRYSNGQFTSGEVEGHTNPCPATDKPSDAQVIKWMKDHLSQNGFDISSINNIP